MQNSLSKGCPLPTPARGALPPNPRRRSTIPPPPFSAAGSAPAQCWTPHCFEILLSPNAPDFLLIIMRMHALIQWSKICCTLLSLNVMLKAMFPPNDPIFLEILFSLNQCPWLSIDKHALSLWPHIFSLLWLNAKNQVPTQWPQVFWDFAFTVTECPGWMFVPYIRAYTYIPISYWSAPRAIVDLFSSVVRKTFFFLFVLFSFCFSVFVFVLFSFFVLFCFCFCFCFLFVCLFVFNEKWQGAQLPNDSFVPIQFGEYRHRRTPDYFSPKDPIIYNRIKLNVFKL